jgi:D-alanine-D-alanine ligase
MPIEIITGKNKDGHRILDFDVKKTDQERVKKVLDENLHGQLSEMGKSVFKILGGKSFGRIDIKLCGENIPHFMEANLMPGLSKGYFFRSCALNLGIGYEQMILLIAGNRLTD